MNLGSVSLVGAGPGDPQFLTLKGQSTLNNATVIFYDSLLAESFKPLFPKGVPSFHVGKRCQNHSLPQRQIERQLISWARAGHRVVRLKGGDPFIFGRGGEEVEALTAAGISYEIVPGLSSINGIATHLGLPLTHRQMVRKMLVVEGHNIGQDPDDWQDLATFTGTLVILMAAKKTAFIAKNLIDHGADPSTKIMLVESEGMVHQRYQVASLELASCGELRKTTSGPGIIYVSRTINLFEGWQRQLADQGVVNYG